MLFFFPLLLAFHSFSFSDKSELGLLFKEFDHDHDKKITVEDHIPDTKIFKSKIIKSDIRGTYFLSNLAQELKLSEVSGKSVKKEYVFENPVDRISRSIRERYWNGLTRRIDAETLLKVIVDPKIKQQKYYLYIPPSDKEGMKYYENYKSKNVVVEKLPAVLPEGFIQSLGSKQGLLSLAMKEGKGVPYVVPGGRFNEMYGWDTYFHVIGTLIDHRPDLALGMAENFIYEIEHYGKILNANRTYYLSRSQPPFFTSLLRELLDQNVVLDKVWLVRAVRAALKEYHTVWMGQERLTSTGLSRYSGIDKGMPPEVEPGHFNYVLKPYAKKYKISVQEVAKRFSEGKLHEPELTAFFEQDRAVRESGHDTTYRWRVDGKDRALDFVTVDLNSLLYKCELDLSFLIKKYFNGNFENSTATEFEKAAIKRKKLILKYFWNTEKKLFFDYDVVRSRQSTYLSATTFWVLWASAGHEEKYKILSKNDAKKFVQNALRELEEKGGLAATAKSSWIQIPHPVERQWDWPNGWAPHQILAWRGLVHYGFQSDAERIIYKWLSMITKNARDYNGTIPEKYNVVSASHKVFAEYGNVGTKFSYITTEGFGWMNASYQLGLKLLSKEKVSELKQNTAPGIK